MATACGRPLMVLVALALALGAGGCNDPKKKMLEAQKTRDAEKKAWEESQEAKRKAAIPKIEQAKLEPFWDDAAFLRVSTGKPCPDGLWALFPGTPGEGAEKEANEAKRAELAAKMRKATFYTVLPHGLGVDLRKYNAKKKTLTVEVEGLVECFDGLGLLTVAWGEPAKAFRPPKPADDEEESTLSPQSVWRAQPLLFPLPFATAAEAKAFTEKQGVGIDARMVFTLGKVDIDKKKLKTSRPLPDAGAVDETLDWGAGRLVHVDLLGVRIATDHEKTQLAEQRKK